MCYITTITMRFLHIILIVFCFLSCSPGTNPNIPILQPIQIDKTDSVDQELQFSYLDLAWKEARLETIGQAILDQQISVLFFYSSQSPECDLMFKESWGNKYIKHMFDDVVLMKIDVDTDDGEELYHDIITVNFTRNSIIIPMLVLIFPDGSAISFDGYVPVDKFVDIFEALHGEKQERQISSERESFSASR